MPADPIASARLSARIASLVTDGCGEADDATGVENGRSTANPNGGKQGAAAVNADAEPAGLAQLALLQTLATARDASNLIVGDEHGDLLFFLDLVDRTMRWLPARLRCVLFLDPRAPATTSLLSDCGDELPLDLVEGWKSWTQRYDVLVAANPRLALADLLSRIDAALAGEEPSFMAEWRPAHQRPRDVPGPNWRQLRLLTAAFDEDPSPKLQRSRQHAGGWVIRDQPTGALVFVSDPDPDADPDVGGEPYV